MTQQQNLDLRLRMENLLQMSKRALEKGATERAEKYKRECYGMETALKYLGYQVELDEENCTVKITEQ